MNYLCRFFLQNLTVWIVWGLILLIGWCFGGRIGIGIAAAILVIIQLLPDSPRRLW